MTVIIYGDEKEKETGETIKRSLSHYGEVHYYKSGETIFSSGGERGPFLIYELKEPHRLEGIKGLFIFKDKFSEFPLNLKDSEIMPVVSAQNPSAAELLNGTGKIAITCGTSQKDTLSIASLGLTTAVVSLQRYLTTISGRVIEPHDFQVKLKKETQVYPLLVACAALLMAEIQSVEGYEF